MQAPSVTVSAPGPLSTAPGFFFQRRHGKLDWRKLATVNLEKVVQNVDVDTLQDNVEHITFADLTEDDLRYFTDQNFLKLFRMCQLMIEYLLNVQNYLLTAVQDKDAKLTQLTKENDEHQKQLRQKEIEIATLKKENKAARKMLRTYEKSLGKLSEQRNLVAAKAADPLEAAYGTVPGASVASAHKCSLCQAAFITDLHLKQHMQRKHAMNGGGLSLDQRPPGSLIEKEALEKALQAAFNSLQQGMELRFVKAMQAHLDATRGTEEHDMNYRFARLEDTLKTYMSTHLLASFAQQVENKTSVAAARRAGAGELRDVDANARIQAAAAAGAGGPEVLMAIHNLSAKQDHQHFAMQDFIDSKLQQLMQNRRIPLGSSVVDPSRVPALSASTGGRWSYDGGAYRQHSAYNTRSRYTDFGGRDVDRALAAGREELQGYRRGPDRAMVDMRDDMFRRSRYAVDDRRSQDDMVLYGVQRDRSLAAHQRARAGSGSGGGYMSPRKRQADGQPKVALVDPVMAGAAPTALNLAPQQVARLRQVLLARRPQHVITPSMPFLRSRYKHDPAELDAKADKFQKLVQSMTPDVLDNLEQEIVDNKYDMGAIEARLDRYTEQYYQPPTESDALQYIANVSDKFNIPFAPSAYERPRSPTDRDRPGTPSSRSPRPASPRAASLAPPDVRQAQQYATRLSPRRPLADDIPPPVNYGARLRDDEDDRLRWDRAGRNDSSRGFVGQDDERLALRRSPRPGSPGRAPVVTFTGRPGESRGYADDDVARRTQYYESQPRTTMSPSRYNTVDQRARSPSPRGGAVRARSDFLRMSPRGGDPAGGRFSPRGGAGVGALQPSSVEPVEEVGSPGYQRAATAASAQPSVTRNTLFSRPAEVPSPTGSNLIVDQADVEDDIETMNL